MLGLMSRGNTFTTSAMSAPRRLQGMLLVGMWLAALVALTIPDGAPFVGTTNGFLACWVPFVSCSR